MFSAVLGVAALVLDGGLVLAEWRHAQAAADAAALAAAVELSKGNSGSTGASNVGQANGYTAGEIACHIPPTSGPFVGLSNYAEVIITHQQPASFGGVFGIHSTTVQTRAVAGEAFATQPVNILVLNSGNANQALTVSGSATISVPGAVIVDDASAASNRTPLSVTGSASLVSATEVEVNQVSSLSSVHVYAPTSGSQTDVIYPAANVSDPLSSLAVPSTGSLTVRKTSKYTAPAGTTLQPGIYQGGLVINSGTVTMASGIYYIEGGGLTVSGAGVTLDGTAGVMIYNGETNGATNNPNSVGAISIQGGGVAKLTAMTTGTYSGISIFQDRLATASFTISGGSGTNITGAVYAAKASGTVSGGSNITPGAAFISDKLTVSGSSNLSLPASPIEVTDPSKHVITLVE
jgi:hypothetical protein